MRKAALLLVLIMLISLPGCGSSDPVTPKWPPDLPAFLTPPDVDAQTVLSMIFYLTQPFDYDWDIETWGRDTIWGGFEEILADAIAGNNNVLAESVISAMGQVGFIEFLPTLADSLGLYPFSVCYSLRGMDSDYAVYLLIEDLDNMDPMVRDVCVESLGEFPYYGDYPYAREKAVEALQWRLGAEPEAWIRDDIIDALSELN
jgi:hypothetical protein